MERSHFKNLISQAQNLDQDAFSKLYRDYITPVFRFLYVRTGNRDLAHDLAHTVFIKAFEVKDIFIKSPQAWLLSIARNTLIDYWRKKKELPLSDQESFVADDRVPIEDSIDVAQKFSRVRRALSRLSDDQQEIITLKFIEGLDNNTISYVTKKSQTAIRSLQYRALSQLRELLLRDGDLFL